MTTFKVERVEPLKPLSHADFMFRKVVCTLIRLTDGRAFQIRRSPSRCWSAGELVVLDEGSLEEAGR
jgi:hypothetical protein